MLSIHNVSLNLGDFSLSDISVDIAEGEYIVVLGMSGVGKTVLLEILAGILECDQGRLILEGKEIAREKIQKRPFGLVYQDQALFPHLSVRRNLEYGLRSQKHATDTIKKRVGQIAEELGIDHLLRRSPATLSGGEAQRVALGRALVTEPRILLLDEPLSALDTQSRANMQRLLRKIHRQGQTIIHVTHDYEEAVSLASRIVLMEGGSIIQTGEPNEIFQQPRSQFVARFVGIRNFIEGYLKSAEQNANETATFTKNGVELSIVTDCDSGPGYFMLRSEDIILSNRPDETSALNRFKGVIADVVPSSSGAEIIIDVGFEISSMVTKKSARNLELEIGKEIFLSFKATAGRFIQKGDS